MASKNQQYTKKSPFATSKPKIVAQQKSVDAGELPPPVAGRLSTAAQVDQVAPIPATGKVFASRDAVDPTASGPKIAKVSPVAPLPGASKFAGQPAQSAPATSTPVGGVITPNQLVSINPDVYTGGDTVIGTPAGEVIVRTDKNIYFNTYETVIEQRYFNNGGGGSLDVGTVTGAAFTDVVPTATKLGFSTSDGFGVVDLGGGLARVTLAGGGGASGYSGRSGWSGAAGAPGTPGTQGASGYSGVAGAAGAAGTSGWSGFSGTNGTNGASGFSGWSGSPGAGTPAGSDTEVQFNDNNSFGANSGFTYNKNTCTLGITNLQPSAGQGLNINFNNGTSSWYNVQGPFNNIDKWTYSAATAVDSTNSVYTLYNVADYTGVGPAIEYTVLEKYNSDGALQYQKKMSQTADAIRSANVAVDSTGNVLVLTKTASNSSHITKYNSAGSVIWSKEITGVASADYLEMNGLAIDSSDNIVVTGAFASGPPTYNETTVIIKFDSSGNILWQKQILVSDTYGSSSRVAIDASGNIYVGTLTFNVGRPFVAKFDSLGNLLWQRETNANIIGRLGGLAVDTSSNVYIAGSSAVFPNNFCYIVKFDNLGNTVWQQNVNFGPFGIIYVHGVTVDPSGNIYVKGTFNRDSGNITSKIFVLKISSSGSIIWSRVWYGFLSEYIYEQPGQGIIATNEYYTFIGDTESFDGQLNVPKSLVVKLPSDGSLTGVYPVYTYESITVSTTSTPFTFIASSYVVNTPSFGEAASSITVTNASEDNFYYLIAAGGNLGYTLDQTGLQLPGYTIPVGVGLQWQSLTSNGDGTISWSYPCSQLDYRGNYFIGGGQAIDCCAKSNISIGLNSLSNNTYGYGNVAFAQDSLRYNTCGSYNLAVGYGALCCNTIGYSNIGIGFGSLRSNITGYGNTAVGYGTLASNLCNPTFNTALGYNAMRYSFGVQYCNVAIGFNAMNSACNQQGSIGIGNSVFYFSSSGCNNIAIGYNSQFSNAGFRNISIGESSLLCNSTGACNIALGSCTLLFNTTGSSNIAVGHLAGCSITTGANNTVIGSLPAAAACVCTLLIGAGTCERIRVDNSGLYVNGSLIGGASAATPTSLGIVFGYTTGNGNSAIGCCAGNTTQTGCDNIAIGRNSLITNTAGTSNIALGLNSLCLNTTGAANTAIGTNALRNNTTGVGNIAIGFSALSAGTNNHNIAQGYQSMVSTGTGRCNVAIGHRTLFSNCTGSENVAVGVSALYNTLSSGNTAVGSNALGCISGEYNTGLGFYAGQGISGPWSAACVVAIGPWSLLCNRGNLNIAIGACAGCNITTGVNNTVIGSLPAATSCVCTVLIGAGTCERIRVDNSGLYVNGTLFSGGSPATPTSLGTVFGYTTTCSNVAIGCCAGNTSMSGANNIAVGCLALVTNTTGAHNIALGLCSLNVNTGGTQNFAAGQAALGANTTGSGNIAIGNALLNNTFGSNNFAAGCRALECNTTGCFNVAIGCCALYRNYTGVNNIAVGANSLGSNQSGNNNTSFGYGALTLNSTGGDNIAVGCNALRGNFIGNANIALGLLALCTNTSGSNNIALGSCALRGNTTGNGNIAIGSQALRDNSTGIYNVANGYQAMRSNTTGENNIAIGTNSLFLNTTGCGNVVAGYQSLYCNVNGNNNVAIGYAALRDNVSGNNSVAIGICAGRCITTGTNNTVIGALPAAAGCVCTVLIGAGTCERIRVDNTGLYVNGTLFSGGSPATPTSLGTVFGYTTGSGNVAIGCCAGNTTQTGIGNIAIGLNTLTVNTTGARNIAIGTNALCLNITGVNNIAVGYGALFANTRGDYNLAFGAESLIQNCTGACNVGIGFRTLFANTIGAANTAVGTRALENIQNGNCNTAQGYKALYNNTTGSNNIGIGLCAGCSITTGANNTVIGSLPAAAACVCTVLIGAGTCERAKIDNAGLCINGSLLSQGDGLSTTAAGWRITPVNSQSADYPLVADDSGRLIFHPASDANARTYTIPANGSVAYPVGTTITFANDSSSNITIAITTDTLVLVGSGATGSRTLSQYGVATAVKVESTKWYISGTNLT